MALLSKTQEAYYNQSQTFTGNGSTTAFTLTTTYFTTLPSAETEFEVFIEGTQISSSNYSYSSPTLTFSSTDVNLDVQVSTGAPISGNTVVVREVKETEQYGNYQFIKLVV